MQISKLHAGNTEYDTFDSFNFACVIACILRKVFIHKKKKGILSVCMSCAVCRHRRFFLFLLSFRFSCPLPSFQFDVLWDTERTHIHLVRDSMVKLRVLCGK